MKGEILLLNKIYLTNLKKEFILEMTKNEFNLNEFYEILFYSIKKPAKKLKAEIGENFEIVIKIEVIKIKYISYLEKLRN